jgi:hypothetical protein
MVANCCAIGRSSVDATKASLILCARAAPSLLAAGLNTLFRPLGVVTGLRPGEIAFFLAFEAADPVFFAELAGAIVSFVGTAIVFPEPVVFFFVPCDVADTPEFVAFGVASSDLFPSTRVTAVRAQNSDASASAALVADLREKIEFIVSLYADLTFFGQQGTTHVTFPIGHDCHLSRLPEFHFSWRAAVHYT